MCSPCGSRSLSLVVVAISCGSRSRAHLVRSDRHRAKARDRRIAKSTGARARQRPTLPRGASPNPNAPVEPQRIDLETLDRLLRSLGASPARWCAQFSRRDRARAPRRRPPAVRPAHRSPVAARSVRGAAGASRAPAAAATSLPATMSLSDVQQHPEMTKLPNGPRRLLPRGRRSRRARHAISNITGKRFIYGGKVRNIKANVYSPPEGHGRRGVPGVPLDPRDQRAHRHPARQASSRSWRRPGVATQTTPIYDTAQPVPDRGSLRHAPLPPRAHLGRRGRERARQVQDARTRDITVYAAGQHAHHHRHRRRTSAA